MEITIIEGGNAWFFEPRNLIWHNVTKNDWSGLNKLRFHETNLLLKVLMEIGSLFKPQRKMFNWNSLKIVKFRGLTLDILVCGVTTILAKREASLYVRIPLGAVMVTVCGAYSSRMFT